MTSKEFKRKKRTYPLGFGIEKHQIVHNNGSAHPATEQELTMWDALPLILRRQLDPEQFNVQNDS